MDNNPLNILESFEKNLKGDLSRNDKHRLEKASLEDVFLGDALEGIEMFHKSSNDKVFTRLRDRIEFTLKSIRTKTIKLLPYAVAAGLTILLAISFLFDPGQEAESLDDTIALLPDKIETPEKSIVLTPEIDIDKADTESRDGISLKEKPVVESRQPAINPLVAENDAEGLPSPQTPEKMTIVVPESEEGIAKIIESTPQEFNAREALGFRAQDKSNLITQPSLLKIDSSRAMPLIGFDSLNRLVETIGPGKEDFFMRGLKTPYEVVAEFTFDQDGNPRQIKVNPDLGDWINVPIRQTLKLAGPWSIPSRGYQARHTFVFQ